MAAPTVTLKGANGKTAVVGKLGYGLMNFTWKPKQTPDAQAFESIKTATGTNVPKTLLNSAEFYGQPDPTLNLQLLNRFYSSNPQLVDSTFLAVKGGVNANTRAPDASPENLRNSIDHITSLLKGSGKKMDMFEPARVDKTRPIEETMKNLKVLADEGKVDFIGLSEMSAETLRRAHKVYPISSVEVEYSPWSLDIESNGILQACRELQIPIFAYSPLGRGMLTGTIRSPDDIPEGDFKKGYDRFQPENFAQNLKLVDGFTELAKKKGCTSATLCLAWLMKQDPLIVPMPGSTRPDGVKEALQALEIKLTAEEDKEIRDLCEKADIKGGRYTDAMKATLEG